MDKGWQRSKVFLSAWNFVLTVSSNCFFWQLPGIRGWWYHPRKISKTTGRMTMTFLPDIRLNEEARNQKKINITWLVCKLQTKIPKKRFLAMQLLGMLTSLNFAGLSILMSEIDPENFRPISSRLDILQNNIKNVEEFCSVKYITANKMHTRSREFLKFTRLCHDIII